MIRSEKYINGKYVKTKKILTPIRMQFFFLNNDGLQTLISDEEVSPEFTIHNGCGYEYCDESIKLPILKPGRYKVVIETLKDVPEFKGIRVEFGFITYKESPFGYHE